MNENQTQPVANTETQTKDAAGSTLTPDKAEQQSLANSESLTNQEQFQNTADKSVKENTAGETSQEKSADTSDTDRTVVTDTKYNAQAKADSPTTKPADVTQPAQPKDDAAKSTNPPATNDQPSKPATENPANNSNNLTAEPPKKLSDVVPSTIVWLSGMVGKKQFDCVGPFSVPFVLDKPTWPYVTIAPNPKYTNQVFDYDADGGAGKWVPTDAKSQGQMLTDLAKQVTTLKDDSQKHDQSADQSQKMGMQLTKVMLQLSSKVDALNTKIDGIVKGGDK
ncbi:hypothetical protein [Lactobacillus crispatus]|uniref:hypothetical protein n=1 Tax=Lactobacillus crispatus TaxID=47770 RepID=UPI000B5D9C1A|nr:hypothetical protein [Lactobacillus crispatus]OXC15452.1 hypothetical protein AYP78_04215 [Lactobacillus crispatus]OXC16733.1 hypothetical protein AYP79_08915 [Lactobacillus crispatus]OXC16957.1 hypothetical protein AYP80_03100 [Lactobacillus crispatus]OXC26323.1 hypothetical protein AYP84_01130 [Lactobacillus crispatus]